MIGNAAGGKSTLARHLARRRELALFEVDRLLWQQGWQVTPADDYARGHAAIVAQDRWVIDGLGRQDSIAERLARSTEIILIDMPLWMHFWHAAERQIAWAQGLLADPPCGRCRNAADAGTVQDDVGGRSNLAAGRSQHVRGGGTGGQSGDTAWQRRRDRCVCAGDLKTASCPGRSAISAFTRVFDALWRRPSRRGALLIRGRNRTRCS